MNTFEDRYSSIKFDNLAFGGSEDAAFQIESLTIEIFPSVRETYVTFSVHCCINGKDYHTSQIVPQNDLLSRWELLFACARQHLWQALKSKTQPKDKEDIA